MSLQKAASLTFQVQGDGTSTTFVADLLKDPYFVQAGVKNWFSEDRKDSEPIAIIVDSPSGTATMSGLVVSVTLAVAPTANTLSSISCHLLF